MPEGHLAFFISDTVEELDLEPFYSKYRGRKNDRGNLAYEPRMLLKVLLYSYCVGIFSSRKIAAGIEDLVPLRYLASGNSPGHRTIARFRREHMGRRAAGRAPTTRDKAGQDSRSHCGPEEGASRERRGLWSRDWTQEEDEAPERDPTRRCSVQLH